MGLAVQAIRWVAFGVSASQARTIVHFFPSEGGVSAPYPATCTLRIFGPQMQERKVVIEGARLSHPDGIRLEQAFPFLATEQIGLFGVEIEVATIQPRVDVSPSSCIIELISKGYSVRYWPVLLAPVPTLLRPSPEIQEGSGVGEQDEPQRVFPLIRDSFCISSVVVVNGGTESYTPKVMILGTPANSASLGTSSENILSGGVVECSCEDSLFSGVPPKDTSWGLLRLRTLASKERATSSPRGAFLVNRDPLSRRLVSVVSLVESVSI